MDLILWRHAEAEAGGPDSARKLTERGQEQARRIAAWLKPRLPGNCEILVSPAARAQQTVRALGVAFMTTPAVGTDAAAADIIAAVDWPARPAVLIVGHQPTLGRVAVVDPAFGQRDQVARRDRPRACVIFCRSGRELPQNP